MCGVFAMGYKIKYVAQLCDIDTDVIVEQKELKTKGLSFPTTFNEFGIRHKEQIELIKNAQDFFLEFQCNFFAEQPSCPKCGKKTKKNGKFSSDFHDVFSDHRVTVQRLGCSCGWQSNHSIQGIYGNASHPELVKLQVNHASDKSFDKASKILNDICCASRKINNHATLIHNVTKVGTALEELKLAEQWAKSDKEALQIILNIDGGHVQHKEQGSHSFEELVTTAYLPEDLIAISSSRNNIINKVSVGSAKSDKQKTIKELTKNACLKLGMSKQTVITALTDGATNCWSVCDYLSGYCSKIVKVLDWFHIGKKFKERESKIPKDLVDRYNDSKWKLWHGKAEESIQHLIKIQQELNDSIAVEKINELINYINNNINSIVNYEERKNKNQPFTSQLAEASINSIINERQKNKKMQWTREGAHNILQIRTSVFSKNFDSDWSDIELKLYKKAA